MGSLQYSIHYSRFVNGVQFGFAISSLYLYVYVNQPCINKFIFIFIFPYFMNS
jgi:hypothetical protein